MDTGGNECLRFGVRQGLFDLPETVDWLLEADTQALNRLELRKQLHQLKQDLERSRVEIVAFRSSLRCDSDDDKGLGTLRLRRGEVGVALLRLVAAAVRMAPPPPIAASNGSAGPCAPGLAIVAWQEDFAEVCDAACRLVGAILRGAKCTASCLPLVHHFAVKVLRMDTLQAASRQLAMATEGLPHWTAAHEGVLRRTTYLLHELAWYAAQPPAVSVAAQLGQRPFLEELVKSIKSSCVVEHTAQLAVRLLVVAAGGDPPGGTPEATQPTVDLHPAVRHHVEDAGEATEAASALRAAAASGSAAALHIYFISMPMGRSDFSTADHAAMVLGLAVLCALDGGPAYGLPQQLLDAAVIALEEAAQNWRMAVTSWIGPQDRDSLLIYNMQTTLSNLVTASYSSALRGRLPRRGGLAVLLRLARWAKATLAAGSAAVGAGVGAGAAPAARSASDGAPVAAPATATQAAGTEGGEDGSRTFDPVAAGGLDTDAFAAGAAQPHHDDAFRSAEAARCRIRNLSARLLPSDKAVAALVMARELLRPESPAGRADAEEWWRLALALVLGDADDTLNKQDWERLRDEVFGPLLAFDGLRLPPEPPGIVAAALAAGILPALERMLRRAGEQRWLGPQGHVLRAVEGKKVAAWLLISPLLAYGPPRQTAALVVTVGKVLRRLVEEAERLDVDSACLPISRWAAGVLYAGLVCAHCEGKEQQGECPAAGVQLGQLICGAAREWLPPLLQLAHLQRHCTSQGCTVARGDFLENISYSAVTAILMASVSSFRTSSHTPASTSAVTCTGCPAGQDGASSQDGCSGNNSSRAATTSSSGSGMTDHSRGCAGGVGSGGNGDGDGDASRWWLLQQDELWATLRSVLRLVPQVRSHDNGFNEETLQLIGVACFAVCVTFPMELCAATRAATLSVAATTSTAPGSGATAPSQSHTPLELPLPPTLLRMLAKELRRVGSSQYTIVLEFLAERVELWAKGNSIMGHFDTLQTAMSHPGVISWGVMAGRLGHRAMGRDLLGPVCAHPACTGLQGDSEAGQRLQACGRCGAVGYCCRECQTAHWRAGHKAECVERRRQQGGGAAGDGA